MSNSISLFVPHKKLSRYATYCEGSVPPTVGAVCYDVLLTVGAVCCMSFWHNVSHRHHVVSPSRNTVPRTMVPTNQTMAEIIIHSPNYVLSRGLWLVGFSAQRQQQVGRKKNLSRFRTHYNTTPNVYADLWVKLQMTNNDTARISVNARVGAERTFDYFMMTIHFMACYPREEQMEATFAKSIGPCDRTVRAWCWNYFIPKIAALTPEIIVWPGVWDNWEDPDNEEETIFAITVDGKHCPIQEPTVESFEESRKYFSHKYNGPGLDYEIAISTFSQQCVWVSGPYKAGCPDITVFRDGLKQRLQESRDASGVQYRGIADRGYRGEREYLSVPTSQDTEEVRDFKGRALSRHENFNGRIATYAIVEHTFRSKGLTGAPGTDERRGLVEKHGQCFFAVTVIVQLQLDNGSPLFEV